jgi:hypothetical protein
MTDFRIVPTMKPWPDHTCTRYGFPIFDHPLGDPTLGFFVASWEKHETAVVAACCLGYLPNVVVPIRCFVPEKSDDRA